MQTSFIIMNGSVCDERIDCSDLAVGRAQADQKSCTEKCSFRKKKCTDRTTADPTELALIFYLKIISNT